MADTKAVLIINGKANLEPAEFEAMVEDPEFNEQSKAYGDQPGLIIKHYILALFGEKNIGGGCYLFKSLEDIETYLSSEFWEQISTSVPWEGVTYEAFEVCSE